ncbi:hypothetical protein FQR65_LT03818 [Abscondita terminalis]|nr:hypothetical protein FQR65_LT03818 [Abscondita terminalis]
MDNFGFRDTANTTKLRRSISVNTEMENFPLYKQQHNRSLVHWKRSGKIDPEEMLEEEYPSEDFEYVECGPSPPSDHIYESFEESTTSSDLTVQICLETIKMNLMEHMKSCSGRHQLLDDIENKITTQDNLVEHFRTASKSEINIAFLWSALLKRWDLLDGLLSLGAQLLYAEPHQGLTALHLAAFSGCIPSTQFLLSRGADVNACFKCYSPLHCAAFGDSPETAMVLLNNGARVSALTTNPNNCHESVLHCAVRANAVACVRLLIAEGADTGQTEYTGMSPIHLAADLGHLQCLKIMFETKGINVNAKTKEKELTALHLAAEGGYVDCVELLLQKGADANIRNHRGQTPLHLAARAQSVECVETLLRKGNADPNVGDHDKRTPLHAAVGKRPVHTISSRFSSKRDFATSPLRCVPPFEMGKIRKYYIARMLFCFVFILSLSLYVLTALAHNCYNHGQNLNSTHPKDVIELCEKKSIMGRMLRNNPFVIEMQWFVLVGITACEILRKIYGLVGYPTLKQYLSYPENVIEWLVIISVFVISFVYTNRTYMWQNHVGAFAVLLGWTNLMLMIGQLPVFGSYVAMYTKVLGEFAKLLLAYSCLLIGFAISFCVIFPDSSTFANPFIGLITVLVMMTGEVSLDLLVDDDPDDPPFLLEITAQVAFVLFLLFVTVILMNLLVGIAVHDIQGLQKTAGLSKLVRQTKLISYMELALFNGYLPKYILNLLHLTALVSPRAYRVVLNVKPLNPREKRLPRDILNAAYEIARQRKNYSNTLSYSGSTTATWKKWFNNNSDQNSDIVPENPLNINLQNKVERATNK